MTIYKHMCVYIYIYIYIPRCIYDDLDLRRVEVHVEHAVLGALTSSVCDIHVFTCCVVFLAAPRVNTSATAVYAVRWPADAYTGGNTGGGGGKKLYMPV